MKRPARSLLLVATGFPLLTMVRLSTMVAESIMYALKPLQTLSIARESVMSIPLVLTPMAW